MGEELFDEFDFPSTEKPGEGLAIRGGYCRDEVWIGLTESDGSIHSFVVVDGHALREALNSMNIGTPPMLTRRRKTVRSRAPKRRVRK